MRYVLHVGQTKAGSTGLQHFLVLNRSRLLESGFLYAPGLRHRTQHSFIGTALHDGDDQTVADFISATETEATSAGAHTIVLSGETLINVRPRHLRRLADMIDSDVQVILYVRNYLERVIARLTQHQKAFPELLEGEAVDAFMANLPNPSEQIANYERVFGEAAVVVRSYASARAAGLERDFCSATGIPWRDDYALPAPINRTPDLITAKVLNNLQYEFGLPVGVFLLVDDGSRCYRLPRLLEGYVARLTPLLEGLDLSHPKLAPLKDELLCAPDIVDSARPSLTDYLDDLIGTLIRLRDTLADRERLRELRTREGQEASER